MIYDIHTTQAARESLERLSGIPYYIWEERSGRESHHEDVSSVVDRILQDCSSPYFLVPHETLEIVFLHITTSANNCASIRNSGLLDLRQAYSFPDSELRIFLNNNGVTIDLENERLRYKDDVYNIQYQDRHPHRWSKEYLCWLVGRKFYFDYALCGFLSVDKDNPYSGLVHRRPEVLNDIDRLLGTSLSRKWETTHSSFAVIAKVEEKNIVSSYTSGLPNNEIIKAYIEKAYCATFEGSSERTIILRNNICIDSRDIISINPLQMWE